MNNKLKNVIRLMKEKLINKLLISDPNSIFYLTGKMFNPGERLVLLSIDSGGEVKLYLNKLFPMEADFSIDVVYHTDDDNPIMEIARELKGEIGVDKNLPARFLIDLIDKADESNFVLGSFIVDYLRGKKDDKEITLMRKSSKINDLAMDKMKERLSDNLSEIEMRDELLGFYKELGAKEFSFEPIIGYGKNCSDPHHETDDSKLEVGDSIIVDMGCILNNYCSDMTRTFFYKSVSKEQKKVYETVRKAQEAAIAKVKPGVKLSDIDKEARKIIEDAGYGEYFTHRTGHFIGIEVHEYGDVSSINDNVCEVGNIFSIEPGIYIPNKFGVRIEDLVLVTDNGCEVLNTYSKDLTII